MRSLPPRRRSCSTVCERPAVAQRDSASQVGDTREVLARMRAVMRRDAQPLQVPITHGKHPRAYRFAGWVLNLNTRRLSTQDETLLPPRPRSDGTPWRARRIWSHGTQKLCKHRGSCYRGNGWRPYLNGKALRLPSCAQSIRSLAYFKVVKATVHRQPLQAVASVGSDIVTQFFTLGRSCILAYQA